MRVVILIDDRISGWEAKGELLAGYFNPDAVFEHVTVVGLISDHPTAETIRLLAKPAETAFLTLGMGRVELVFRTLGMRRWLLRRCLRPVLEQLKQGKPDLVRAYGDGLAAATAGIFGQELAVPYVISLHTTPEPAIRRRFSSMRDRIWRGLLAGAISKGLQGASRILAVYSPILHHLPPILRQRAVVVPNVVAEAGAAIPRMDAQKHGRDLRILWIGRMIPGRDPAPIIEAVARAANFSLTIIGDGPLAPAARTLAVALGGGDRIKFVPAMPNAKLIEMLREYDVLAARTDYLEIPKSVMEASLAGLPIVINQTPSADLAEYKNFPAILVEPDAASYAAAFDRLAGDNEQLRELAMRTRGVARTLWDPGTVARQAALIMRAVVGERTAENK